MICGSTNSGALGFNEIGGFDEFIEKKDDGPDDASLEAFEKKDPFVVG